MKSIFSITTILLLTAMTASASLNMSDVTKTAEGSSIEGDSLKSLASAFLGSMDDNKSATNAIEGLLSGIASGDGNDAVSALQSLSNMDFSKDQLKTYGSLLASAAPMILGSTFDLENGDYGKYIGMAIEFFQSGNFAKAGDAISSASQFFDADSDKGQILSGIVSSYAPMLQGMDLEQAVDIGKSLLGNSKIN